MKQPLVNLRVDFACKQLFGAQEELLISFLNAILHESLYTPIVSLKIEEPHLYKEYEEDKLSLLDILATEPYFGINLCSVLIKSLAPS
ncbi:hypothetical protein CDB3_21985 [Bacillus sp. CDB3]|nr:hypothetical protein CDB3_21985 [Bacillus sp. CDB3]